MTVPLWGTLRGTARSPFGNEPSLIPLLGRASPLCWGFVNSEEPRNNCFSFWQGSLSISLLESSGTFLGEKGTHPGKHVYAQCPLLHISLQLVLPVLCYSFRHGTSLVLHLHLGLEVILNFNCSWWTQKPVRSHLTRVTTLHSFPYDSWFHCLIKSSLI